MKNSLNFLSTRSGFNTSLKHFKLVTSIVKSVENSKNLSDIINQLLDEKKIEQYQIPSILNALLVDKYNYVANSFNLKNTFNGKFSDITNIVKNWLIFDIVVSYYHPQLGTILINPKNVSSWESIDNLKENELVVIYVGNFNKQFDDQLAKKASVELGKLLSSEITSTTLVFKNETPKEQIQKNKSDVKETKKTSPTITETKSVTSSNSNTNTQSQPVSEGGGGKKKMSPQYGITVTNELFHNGNVEAWKKIIKSYESKYTDMKVLIFYEGEQIHDINTLFKWGKVKHGTNIYISLLGTDFKDISKLRRYLSQGASPRFEDFLKGDPTKELKLF